MNRIRSITLKFWLPFVYLFVFVTLSGLSLWYNYSSQRSLLIHKSADLVTEDLSGLSQSMEYSLQNDMPVIFRRDMASRAINPRYDVLVASDPQGRITQSTKSKFLNRSIATSVEGFRVSNFERLKKIRKPIFHYDETAKKIYAYFPVVFAAEEGGIRPAQTGLIFAQYDLSVDFMNLTGTSLHKSLVFSAILFGFMVLIVLFTYYFINRPVRHLIEVSNLLADSESDVRADIHGQGEFTLLGARFNHMADKLKSRLAKQVRAEKEAVNREELLSKVLLAIEDLFFILDLEGEILDFKSGAPGNLYMKPEKFLHKKMQDILPGDVAELFREAINSVRYSEELTSFQYSLQIHGEEKFFEARLRLLNDKTRIIAVIRDINERVIAEQQMYHQAHYDALTALPNRFLALDRLRQMLLEGERDKRAFAVMFIDLDDFKKINDTLGHETGDKLLVETAGRLKSVMRKPDTIGRLGGDEFIVLMRPNAQMHDISQKAQAIVDLFAEPFRIEGRDLLVSVSVGIAVFPNDGNNVSELIRKADSAMYHAKSNGRNMYCYFTSSMNDAVARRLAVEEQMHGALQRGEFEVYYQPQFQLTDHRVIGVEALLRWKNPVLGLISPTEFIPIAEQNGNILSIGKFVLQCARDMLDSWHKEGKTGMRVAANLSPRQFRDPTLLPYLEELFTTSMLHKNRLELEITEGVLLTGHREVRLAIAQLHELGIELAMDDFGTGYSSLNYLRQYPFDVLKIDKSFIDDITRLKDARDLVYAIISMSHALGLKVVAEGIESQGQLEALKEFGCDIGQGFYLARPMPREDFERWLKEQPVHLSGYQKGRA